MRLFGPAFTLATTVTATLTHKVLWNLSQTQFPIFWPDKVTYGDRIEIECPTMKDKKQSHGLKSFSLYFVTESDLKTGSSYLIFFRQ